MQVNALRKNAVNIQKIKPVSKNSKTGCTRSESSVGDVVAFVSQKEDEKNFWMWQ